MTRVLLVRHARPTGSWADSPDPDPGLDARGHAQAAALAADVGAGAARPILCSPMRRTRETAAPLAAAWAVDVSIEPAVGEIPSSSGFADVDERGAWLRQVMAGTYADADATIRAWRDALVRALVALEQDTVVVSHFVAINAAVGAARGDDGVLQFRPDLASVTELAVVDGRLELVRLGPEADTQVR